MNHTKLFKSFDKCPRLPLWVKKAAKKSILEQKLDCRNSPTLFTAFSWMKSKERVAVWCHLDEVVSYGKELNLKRIPASWKKGKPTAKKELPVFKTIAACTDLPKSVRDGAIASLKEQKIKINAGTNSVISAFFWSDTHENTHVWEHLHKVIVGTEKFEASKVPAHWLVTPLAKRVTAAPKKLGFEDICVCAAIRACKNIPGVVRQKLIAEVIDVANGVFKDTHPRAKIWDKRTSSVALATLWEYMPSGYRIWEAVNDCAEDESKAWPW